MNNDELAAIDDAMSAFYETNKNLFDKQTAAWIAEYIHVGEWGLAVELIVFCLERDGLQVPESEKDKVYALARKMNLNLDKTRANWPKS